MGLITDIPTCKEPIERIVGEAEAIIMVRLVGWLRERAVAGRKPRNHAKISLTLVNPPQSANRLSARAVISSTGQCGAVPSGVKRDPG
jgi:hypothetical protein